MTKGWFLLMAFMLASCDRVNPTERSLGGYVERIEDADAICYKYIGKGISCIQKIKAN